MEREASAERRFAGRAIVAGDASGEALVSIEPLSFVFGQVFFAANEFLPFESQGRGENDVD